MAEQHPFAGIVAASGAVSARSLSQDLPRQDLSLPTMVSCWRPRPQPMRFVAVVGPFLPGP